MTREEKHAFLLHLYRKHENQIAEYLTTIKIFGDFIVDFLYPIEAKFEDYFKSKNPFGEFEHTHEIVDDDKPTLIDKLNVLKDKTVQWLEDVPYHLQFVKEYKHRKKHKLSRRDSYCFAEDFYSLIRENLNYALKALKENYDMESGDSTQQVDRIHYAMDLCTALEFLDEKADPFITICLHPEYPKNFYFENYISEKEWEDLNRQLNQTLKNKFAELMIIIKDTVI